MASYSWFPKMPHYILSTHSCYSLLHTVHGSPASTTAKGSLQQYHWKKSCKCAWEQWRDGQFCQKKLLPFWEGHFRNDLLEHQILCKPITFRIQTLLISSFQFNLILLKALGIGGSLMILNSHVGLRPRGFWFSQVQPWERQIPDKGRDQCREGFQ